MGILRRLFETKEAREKREEAERFAEEADAKRRAAEEAQWPKCERCGRSAERLLPVQIRAVGTEDSVDLNVCGDCFHEAATMAQDVGFKV